MRRALLALALCCALSLTGCSALLERPYAVVESHTEQPAAGDGSSIQVGTYSETPLSRGAGTTGISITTADRSSCALRVAVTTRNGAASHGNCTPAMW